MNSNRPYGDGAGPNPDETWGQGPNNPYGQGPYGQAPNQNAYGQNNYGQYQGAYPNQGEQQYPYAAAPAGAAGAPGAPAATRTVCCSGSSAPSSRCS